jgi:Tfp pilus assembly protein PilO
MDKQWNALIKKLRQPKSMLIVVFLLGLLVNGSIYLYKIMPQLLPMHNLSVQYNQLEQQRISLEKQPIPEKIDLSDINKLVEQVPISANTAAFLLRLKELETQSGVEIELISDGKATAPANSDSTGIKSATAAGSANFHEQSFEITIVGPYVQLMDFVNRLKDLPRFVNMKEWQFGDDSTLTDPKDLLGQIMASASGLPANDTNKKRIKLKLSIYSAVQYKDKFPDLPPVSVTENPASRLDPTIPDHQFNKLLESLNGNNPN